MSSLFVSLVSLKSFSSSLPTFLSMLLFRGYNSDSELNSDLEIDDESSGVDESGDDEPVANPPVDQPADQPADPPAEPPADQQANPPANPLADLPDDQPAEPPDDQPADGEADLPDDQPADGEADQPADDDDGFESDGMDAYGLDDDDDGSTFEVNAVGDDADEDDIDETSEMAWNDEMNTGIGQAEEFMDVFFCHASSDAFEELRKTEAASVIPTADDDFIYDCLALIDKAPKSGNEDERRARLLKWTQATRGERVTMFMTKPQIEMEELLAVSPDPSEEVQPRRKTRRKAVSSTPNPIQMDVAGFKTGKTPVEFSNQGDAAFKLRCECCIGVYYGKRVPDPDLRSQMKDFRIRRKCRVCGTNTDYFCFGCRRFLCFSNPKEAKDDNDRLHNKSALEKQPKYFSVKTPVLDSRGELQVKQGEDGEDKYKHEKEIGVWTCYHIAHQTGWKTYLQANRPNILGVTHGKRTRSNSL